LLDAQRHSPLTATGHDRSPQLTPDTTTTVLLVPADDAADDV
jgi:hypothetical protein